MIKRYDMGDPIFDDDDNQKLLGFAKIEKDGTYSVHSLPDKNNSVDCVEGFKDLNEVKEKLRLTLKGSKIAKITKIN